MKQSDGARSRITAMAGLGVVFALTGCGSSDSGSPGGSGGTVTADWAEYCTATFTADVPVEDGFGDVMFTARAGETYLVSGGGGFSDAPELLYLTKAGPEPFNVGSEHASSLESSCNLLTARPYYAVFTDVRVYADEALTTPICDLAAGTALPSPGARGFSVAGELTLDGPQLYLFMLDGFAEQCGGNTRGYVRVPPTEVFGATTWLAPIQGIYRAE